MPASRAQRSSSSAASRRPQKAASATAKDFASARPPKYCLTFSMVSDSPGKSLVSWSAAAASERRSWPTACTSAPAASLSIVAPWRRTSAATNDGNSEALSSPDFDSVTGPSLRSLVEHAAALRAAAVHQHQRRRPRPARRRSRAGRRPTPRGGSPGRGRPRSGCSRTATAPPSPPASPGVSSAASVSASSASASWPRTASRTADDGALVEELLLAGHEGDPTEDVCCASWRACHGARSLPQRRRQLTAPVTASRQVARRARRPRGRRPGRCAAPGPRTRPAAPAWRRPGARSRCRRPPTPGRAGPAARAGSRGPGSGCRGAAP